MRYKTSCFNPTMARSLLRRFWPLPLLVLGGMCLMLLMPLLGVLQNGLAAEDKLWLLEQRAYDTSGYLIVMLAAAALMAAALTFQHIHSRKEIQFYHALPMKRRCLFTTSYLTGLVLVAAPMLLGVLLCMILVAASGFGAAALALLKLFGTGMAALLLFYAMAVLACCLAGQTLGAVLIYVGMNCAVMVILYGAGSLAEMFMPGVNFVQSLAGLRDWLTPLPKLICAAAVRYSEETAAASTADSAGYVVYNVSAYGNVPEGFAEPWTLVIYGVVGAALAVLCGVLYQYRRAECAGEMVAFRPVKSLCKVFGALAVSAGGAVLTLNSGLFQNKIPFAAVLVSVLLFGALGWIAAEMVVQKTLRVFRKKTAVPCGILLVVLLVVMLAGRLDLFGSVRYVPDTAEVETAWVSYNYISGVEVSPEDAAAIHRATLAHPEALTNNSYCSSEPLSITYRMENGRIVTRDYDVELEFDDEGSRLDNPIYDAALEIMKTPDYNYKTWFGTLQDGVTRDNVYHASLQAYNWDDEGNTVERMTWDDPAWRGDYMDLTVETAVQLYEAICRDIAAGNLLPNGMWSGSGQRSLGCIDFECYVESYSAQYGTYNQYVSSVPTAYVSVELRPEMEYTLGCLREMGFEIEPD